MTTPSGSMNLSVKYFRDMLAASPAFQTWTGTPDSTGALERIYYEGLPAPANSIRYTRGELEDYRPYALVYIADEGGFTRDILATTSFDEAGIVVLTLEQTAPTNLGDDPSSDANIQWSNSIGEIVDGLATLRAAMTNAVTDQYLAFDRLRLMARGWASKDQQVAQGLFQRAIIAVDF